MKLNNHPILKHDTLTEAQEEKFFNDIADRFREARKHFGITQREFGEPAGIERRYIAKIECRGQRPSFKVIRCITIYHKISPNWLMFGIGDMFLE